MKTAPALVLLAGAVLIVAGWLIFERPEVAPESIATGDPIRQFCAACHVYPEPASLPRSSWKEEIEKMYALAGLDEDLTGIPPIEDTLERYLREAPVRVAPPETYLGDPAGPLRFDTSGQPRQESPGISYLAYVAFPGERKNLIASDMRTGEVLLQRLHEPGRPVEVLARLAHPCLLKVVDLDHDGRRDLLVAELGSFLPEDHDKGKVVWLRARSDGGYDAVTLLDKVGRVADVSAADFDGDGDLDLIVAVFGWRQTGKLLLMTNTGGRDAPRFDTEQLDPRVGAINVPVVDLDKDGRPDIIAVFSQHHESVVAFLNDGGVDGEGGFSMRTIYEAPHPDWGSSGIEVVDLDGDGDLDVVLVCGDTLDTGILHRHQGVYWLENEGTYPFRAHKLAGHVGAHKVRAADLDGDGDLDLAASSFLPQLRQPGRPRKRLDSVIWIEQTAPGKFSPHPLEAFRCDHAALEVADFDGDGDIDIAVGNFVPGPLPGAVNWWTLFDNAGPR